MSNYYEGPKSPTRLLYPIFKVGSGNSFDFNRYIDGWTGDVANSLGFKIKKAIDLPPIATNPTAATGNGLLGKANKFMPKAMAGLGILNAGLEAFNGNSRTKDTYAFDTEISNRSTIKADNNSIDGLLARWNNYTDMDHIGINDVRTGIGEKIGNSLSGILGGAAAGASLGPLGGLAGAGVGLVSSIAGWIKGDTEAYEKMKKINAQIDRVNTEANNRFNNAVSNIESIQDDRLASNFYAEGGEMNNSYDSMKNTDAFRRYHQAKKSQEGLRQFWYDDHTAPTRQTPIGSGDRLSSQYSVPTIGYGMTVGALRSMASMYKDRDAINAINAYDNGDKSFRITPEMALKFSDMKMRYDYDLIKRNINTNGMSPDQIMSLMYVAYDKPKAISDGAKYNNVSNPSHRYASILNDYKSKYIKPGSGRENGFNRAHGIISGNAPIQGNNLGGIQSDYVGDYAQYNNANPDYSYDDGIDYDQSNRDETNKIEELMRAESEVREKMLKLYEEVYGR